MKNLHPMLQMAGGILILASVATIITGWAPAPYIYSAGALLFTVPQLMDRYNGGNIVIRRLRRQQIFGALMLLMTAFFMFTRQPWIICLAIAAVLELYTSFRLAQEEKKEQRK